MDCSTVSCAHVWRWGCSPRAPLPSVLLTLLPFLSPAQIQTPTQSQCEHSLLLLGHIQLAGPAGRGPHMLLLVARARRRPTPVPPLRPSALLLADLVSTTVASSPGLSPLPTSSRSFLPSSSPLSVSSCQSKQMPRARAPSRSPCPSPSFSTDPRPSFIQPTGSEVAERTSSSTSWSAVDSLLLTSALCLRAQRTRC